MPNADRYINREWSWLEFNRRVLFEALEEENPLLERLKFTAIVTSNLEEFFMVRVAGLEKQRELDYGGSSPDRMSPADQLAGIRTKVRKMLEEQNRNFLDNILPALKKEGVTLLTADDDLDPFENALRSVFRNEILPLLTPISVGATHPFPNLVTGRMYLAVCMVPQEDLDDRIEQSALSFIEVPVLSSGRFIQLEPGLFVPVELIIRRFVGDIYHGYRIKNASVVKCTRDADFSLQEDAAGDLLKEIESKIGSMHHRSVVKVEHETSCPQQVLDVLQSEYGVTGERRYSSDGLLNLNDLFEVYGVLEYPELKDHQLVTVLPTVFNDEDLFKTVAAGDRLLFHPYHSYEPVLRLMEQAAVDPDVLAIKQTLYRTSSNSRIINALVTAAKNGKYVSVIVELKARFDEKRNISWAKVLEDAGAHVIYGLSGLKTHAKALLIVRKEPKGIRRYVHMATGNYNESTARLYTDFSLFTADERTGADISQLFNLLTGFCHPGEWERVTIAPTDLRKRFLDLIGRERQNALEGRKARITAMMNSLSDREIADALYEASQAGVKIRLIVRGICILKPGLKGVSENITVLSTVGRFLQHPRIYIFHNGGDEEIYLASADWMSRNLDRRVELMFPVLESGLAKTVKKLTKLMLEDTENGWLLSPEGSYKRIRGKAVKDCFQDVYRYISELEDSDDGRAETVFKPIRKSV